jgi:hypothetical protein
MEMGTILQRKKTHMHEMIAQNNEIVFTHPIEISIPTVTHYCRGPADGPTQPLRLICMQQFFNEIGNDHGEVIGYGDLS